MRPLPRLHAITDAAVLAFDDLGVRAAAIAAAGSSVALHARDRSAGGARLASVARRFLALARPPEAAVFDRHRKITYVGRINDLYSELGSARPEPTTHELADAIESTLSGQPVQVARTKAIGCPIADLAN